MPDPTAPDQFGQQYSPELNAAVLEQIKKNIALQKEKDIASAQGSAAVRGIAGSSYEGNQIAAANRTASDSETNAAVQMAIQNATFVNQQRQIKQGQEFATSERIGSENFAGGQNKQAQDFSAKQTVLQQQFQDLEMKKQQAFAAGETDKAQAFQAKQDELSRQFQAQQTISGQNFTSGQNDKQRKIEEMTGITNALGQGVGTAVGLCFVGDTEIEMLDGSTKKIKDMQLGDMTKGGVALSWRQAISNHMYDYKGIRVSASHAIKTEDGWKRAMQCPEAKHIPGIFVVYNLVTPTHRIYVNGLECSDEFEFDDPYQPLSESLKRLNDAELEKVK